MKDDVLNDLRRADAHARWGAADSLALRPEAAVQLAGAPVLLAGWMDDDREESPGYTVESGVAVFPISGALMERGSWFWDGYDKIAARYAAAHADSRVRAVLLDVESPGGMTSGLFDAMRAMRATQLSSGKRVVAWVSSGAYSAAYALASTAGEVVVGDTAGVGSVGVIAALRSEARALDTAGVDVRVVSSGDAKTDGHYAVAITPEAEGRLRERITELAAMLFSEVSLGRPGLTVEALSSLGGGVKYGRGAVASGLADRVSTRAAILAELAATGAPSRGTGPFAPWRAQRTNDMDDVTMAAIIAATGEADPAKHAVALAQLKSRADAAESSLARMTEERAAAVARAEAAERRTDEMERSALLEGAKASGQWTPALEGFLSSLSVAQLKSWRETAPRAVPAGQVMQPSDGPQVQKGHPADVAAAVQKAEREGWSQLSAAEKGAVTRFDRELAATLRGAKR